MLYNDNYRQIIILATQSEMGFLNAILVEVSGQVSGHKLESSQTRVSVLFSTLILRSTKCYY